MRRALPLAFGLVCGLALVAWISSVVVHQTTRAWFEKDINLRSMLAVNGARQALISRWSKDQRTSLRGLLSEITRDERILAAAACTADMTLLARTKDFPERVSCADVGAHIRPATGSLLAEWKPWFNVMRLRGGDIHVSAIPVVEADQPAGFVILLHDLSFVQRREATTRRFLLLAFGFLAAAAAVLTLITARLSWRSWSEALRGSLRNGTQRPEFQPILHDVRELVDRIVAEKDSDLEGGAWTAQRLKQTLNRHLHGEKVLIVANREPYLHMRTPSGAIEVLHPASGLVTALEPVMRACSGVWIAHGSGSADKDTVDRCSRVRVPPDEESYVLRRVWLSPEEEKGYYYGFSNEGLWPLCHVAHARPIFRTEDWKQYRTVNEKFVDALCSEVDSEDPIVLVQDYHLALAPGLIRQRLPRATVIMFWHIPWPNSERLGICPWRNELLEGMLGASILGFHTQFHCNNFVESVDRFLEARIDREQHAVVQHGRTTFVRPYPISLEWPVRWSAATPRADECRRAVIESLQLAPDALIGLGVDRLDYTKGVEERFLAVERLLDRYPQFLGRFTFVQLAAPSRTAIERYQEYNESVESLATRINLKHGRANYRPIVLLRSHHEPSEVFRYYRAADLCYVSSLHDGMNLVAKEFISARDDEQGVLILSEFTGAARELTEALIVNPYDLDEASAAIAAALSLSLEEQRDRMRSMRAFLAEFNVYRWAGRMLVDAARIRSRDRLTGRLTYNVAAGGAG